MFSASDVKPTAGSLSVCSGLISISIGGQRLIYFGFCCFHLLYLPYLPICQKMLHVGISNMTGDIIAGDATILLHLVIQILCCAPLCQTGVKSDERLLNTVCHYKTVSTGYILSPLENEHTSRV